MITISTLQSQIAINRRNLSFFEDVQREIKNHIKYAKYEISIYEGDNKEQYVKNMKSVFDNNYKDLARGKKWIKNLAKLQRALKSELAYRIMYNREMRSANRGDLQLK